MIWWCAEHSDSDDERYCNIGVRFKSDCRMVEALLIVKENGEWPKAVIEVLRYDVAALAEAGAVEIMEAIALAFAGRDSQ